MQTLEAASEQIGPTDAFRYSVNVAGFELAQPVINSTGLMRASAVSLPVLSAQKRAGFLSLFNGLLEQNATATRDVATTRPGKRPGATLLPEAAGARQSVENRTSVTDPVNGTVLFQPTMPGAMAGTSVLSTKGEIEGSSTHTQSEPGAHRSLGAMNTASNKFSSGDYSPGPPHDIAFALRLTWQPVKNPYAMPLSGPDAEVPGKTGPGNPIHVVTPNSESVGLSEVASRGPTTTEFSNSDSALESQLFRRNDQLAGSNVPPLQCFQARSLVSDSTVAEGTGLQYLTTMERVRQGNGKAGSAPPDPGPRWEPTADPAEITVQTHDPSGALASVTVPRLVSYPRAAASQDIPTTHSEEPSEAATSTATSQQDGRSESVTSRRPIVAPSGIISATPAGSRSDSGSVLDRDMANFESDRKVPRIESTEKVPPIQNSNQPADHGYAGAWLNRVAVPNSTLEAQVKLSPEPQQPPPASPELETTQPVQSQPIREISFRVAADSGQVDVQVAQRAGRIQVAVRTENPDLMKSLQTNLGDVVGRLEAKGFKTETWMPVTGQHGGGAVREPSSSSNSPSQSDDSGSRSGQRDQRRGQQESNQRQQGRWKAQQLDGTLLAPVPGTYEEAQG